MYRYLSKLWQPEELEAAVDAAAEYARIVARNEELADVRERIATLEREVARLRTALGAST